MKKILILIILPFLFSDCKKDDNPLFVIPMNNITFEIPTGISPFQVSYIDVHSVVTNYQSFFNSAGVSPDSISLLRPSFCRMSVVFAEETLWFIDAISVRICNEAGGQDFNCGKSIFYRELNGEIAGTSITLIPEDIGDISDIFLQDQVKIQVKLERLHETPPATLEIQMDMEFEVF